MATSAPAASSTATEAAPVCRWLTNTSGMPRFCKRWRWVAVSSIDPTIKASALRRAGRVAKNASRSSRLRVR